VEDRAPRASDNPRQRGHTGELGIEIPSQPPAIAGVLTTMLLSYRDIRIRRERNQLIRDALSAVIALIF
jgi:hypothetical protein